MTNGPLRTFGAGFFVCICRSGSSLARGTAGHSVMYTARMSEHRPEECGQGGSQQASGAGDRCTKSARVRRNVTRLGVSYAMGGGLVILGWAGGALIAHLTGLTTREGWVLLGLGVVLLMCPCAAAYLIRARLRCGRVLVPLGRNIIMMTVLLAMGLLVPLGGWSHVQAMDVTPIVRYAGLLSLVLLGVMMVSLGLARTCLCERGVMVGCDLIPWTHVTAWRWEGPDKVRLMREPGRSFSFTIPSDRRDEAERVLRSTLGEPQAGPCNDA